MPKYESFGTMSAKIGTFVGAFKSVERKALQHAGERMVQRVRERIENGELDDIADTTKERRVRQGFSDSPPLLASGQFVNAITYHVARGEVDIVMKPGLHVNPSGSTIENSDLAIIHEEGNSHVPPRAPFGGMIDQYGDEIEYEYVKEIIDAMEGI